MKKIFAIILSVCMLIGSTAQAAVTSVTTEKEYELWTQSPTVTCGLTADDLRIFKALDQDLIEIVNLSQLGDEYFLAVCTYKRKDGGYNAKTETATHYFYVLYLTDDGFIILSKGKTSNEYYLDGGFSLADISPYADKTYYKSNNSEVPYYILNPKDKYTHREYTEYNEYYIITDKGNMYTLKETATSKKTEGYPYIYSNKLYRGQDNYYDEDDVATSYYLADGSTKASNSKPMFFKSGTIKYGTAEKVAISEMTSANGYRFYTEGFSSSVTFRKYRHIPGSDNLYFTTSTSTTYASSTSDYNYNLQINIFRCDKGIMTKITSKKFVAKTGSSPTYAYYAINGLDEKYYTDNGISVPAVAVSEFAVITRDGKIWNYDLDESIYYDYVYPCTYNNSFAITRSRNKSSTIYKENPATGSFCYWQIVNELVFDADGNVTLSEDIELPIRSYANSGQNGFFSDYKTWNSGTFTAISYSRTTDWMDIGFDNTFPDGRKVTATLEGMGGGLYELWYSIYNKDGTLRSTGPTGFSDQFSTGIGGRPDMYAYAVNNSKFVVCLGLINNDFIAEYYRVAVVSEGDTGEVMSKVKLGEKNITPPDDSDTEVVQNKIDFGSNDLPLGYNIKDNVIDTGKLDAILREQVNSIRLNDIVILAKEGYQDGEQNTGVTLSDFSEYEYSFGSAFVRLYTNGQYFRWYCQNPEELEAGVYEKSFKIGDKTLYVTFKVVSPPTSEGSTMVVF